MMSRRKSHKRNKLLELTLKQFDKNETTFIFEKYFPKLKVLYNVLD